MLQVESTRYYPGAKEWLARMQREFLKCALEEGFVVYKRDENNKDEKNG